FSPDGTRLSGLFENFGKVHIVTWTLKDGKVAADVPVEGRPGVFYGGPKLVWSPDASGFLVSGEVVLDAASGKELWKITERDLKGIRRLLAIHTAAGVDESKRPNRFLRSVSPGKEKVAAIQKAVQSGGTAVDALLPKAVDVDVKA